MRNKLLKQKKTQKAQFRINMQKKLKKSLQNDAVLKSQEDENLERLIMSTDRIEQKNRRSSPLRWSGQIEQVLSSFYNACKIREII